MHLTSQYYFYVANITNVENPINLAVLIFFLTVFSLFWQKGIIGVWTVDETSYLIASNYSGPNKII